MRAPSTCTAPLPRSVRSRAQDSRDPVACCVGATDRFAARSGLTARALHNGIPLQKAYRPERRFLHQQRTIMRIINVSAEAVASNPTSRPDQPRTGQPGERTLRTAVTSAAALRGEDRARWQLLASHCPGSAPLVDAPWILSWVDAFDPPEPVLACAWDDGSLVGLAPLQRVPESWLGRRLSVLQSLTNDESFRFDFLSWQGRVDVGEQLWRALCDAGRWDVIRLEHVPEGSPTLAAGLKVARELGWRSMVQPTFLTPWRPLSPTEPWDHGLKRKFKSNLRNRERRLAALGDVSFQVVTGGG